MAKSKGLLAAHSAGWAFALTLFGPQPDAQAQDAAAGAEDEIVVTGSLIADDEALAVGTTTAEDLELRGEPSTVEFIKSSPVVGASIAGDANPLGSSRVEGAASINLRGLGNERTLVLFDGQRIAPITSGATTLVDANLIPLDAIGRIEVLKTGGAATYGSDAIAGVVNFITRTDLDGLEARSGYTFIEGTEGDASVSLQWGRQFDRGNFLIYVGYDGRAELRTTDRDFANRPYLENPQAWTSRSSNPGVFYAFQSPSGIDPVIDPGCEAVGNVRTPLPGTIPSGREPLCLQHYTNFQNLVDRQDRTQAFAEFNHQIADNIEFSLSGAYALTDVPEVRTAPSTFAARFPTRTTQGTSPFAIANFYYVPPTNPGLQDLLATYSAADLGISATQYSLMQTRGVNYLVNLTPFGMGGNPAFGYGAKEDYRRYEQMRLTGELSGGFGSDETPIHWRLTANYSQADAHSSGRDLLVSRVQLALRGLGGPGCDPATGTPGAGPCQYLNVFSTGIRQNAVTGEPNPNFVGNENTPELARWLFSEGDIRTQNRLTTVEGVLDGALGFFELPGGRPEWALGVQYRKASVESDPSDFLDLTLNPCVDIGAPLSSCANDPRGPQAFFAAFTPTAFSSEAWAAFGEIALPIADSLDLRLAGRYEEHPAGTTFNPLGAIRFSPVDWLTLRGSAGTTYRAPSQGQVDPDIGGTVALAVGTTRIPFFRGGNADLEPETSENYSAGLIVDAGGLRFSADYFLYRIKDQIQLEDGPALVNTLLNGHCNDPAFAELQARFVFNSNGCGAVTNIQTVRTVWTNGPEITMSGVDFNLSYAFGEILGVEVSAGAEATYNIEFHSDAFSQFGTVITPAYEGVGLFNFQRAPRTLPEWRGLVWLNLARGDHNLRITYQYSDAVRDERAGGGTLNDILAPIDGYPAGTIVTGGSTIDAWDPMDIAYRWQTSEHVALTFAVRNVFDSDPPLARTDLSYDAFIANPLGRTFRLGFSANF